MWNRWIEKGKELAEHAQKAAAKLEEQLDESVGIAGGEDKKKKSTTTTAGTIPTTTTAVSDNGYTGPSSGPPSSIGGASSSLMDEDVDFNEDDAFYSHDDYDDYDHNDGLREVAERASVPTLETRGMEPQSATIISIPTKEQEATKQSTQSMMSVAGVRPQPEPSTQQHLGGQQQGQRMHQKEDETQEDQAEEEEEVNFGGGEGGGGWANDDDDLDLEDVGMDDNDDEDGGSSTPDIPPKKEEEDQGKEEEESPDADHYPVENPVVLETHETEEEMGMKHGANRATFTGVSADLEQMQPVTSEECVSPALKNSSAEFYEEMKQTSATPSAETEKEEDLQAEVGEGWVEDEDLALGEQEIDEQQEEKEEAVLNTPRAPSPSVESGAIPTDEENLCGTRSLPVQEEIISSPPAVVAPFEQQAEKMTEPTGTAPASAASNSMPSPTTNNDGTFSSSFTEKQIAQLREEHDSYEVAIALLQSQVEELQSQLRQREEQLQSKSEQLTSIQEMHESEKEDLKLKIRETKDEAKRRIQRAKERVEEMQARSAEAARRAAESAGADAEKREAVIAELRAEGEKLAVRQGQMEQSVRAARAEARELREELDAQVEKKETALTRIAELESQLKEVRDELASARRGETRADKLESDLVSAREASEKNAAINLSLEQNIKELKAENKDLKKAVEEAKKEAAMENQRESTKLQREHAEMLADLEMKLRTSEREANVREDALRHEVSELRKRWQDAVRRADALSMDVQQSTAPLMRQLESTERQNRARAAAWAELETKLRSDLEEHVIQNEKLVKERNELRAKMNRLERVSKDLESELKNANTTIDELNDTVERLELKLEEAEREGRKIKEEWVEVERLANEGVSKVRNDMMKTVVDSEERYRKQIDALEGELREERDKRIELDSRLRELAESSEMMALAAGDDRVSSTKQHASAKEKKLKSSMDQAEILRSTLFGLDDDDEDEASAPVDEDDDEGDSPGVGSGSFAAMEQLSQGLRGAMLELEALRKQLAESEEMRESLLAELSEMRQASEKLPLFEAKVRELTQEVQEKDFEIQGLREDIAEVRLMYRSQLDALLEEKAATTPLKTPNRVDVNNSGLDDGASGFSTPSDVAADNFDIVYDGET